MLISFLRSDPRAARVQLVCSYSIPRAIWRSGRRSECRVVAVIMENFNEACVLAENYQRYGTGGIWSCNADAATSGVLGMNRPRTVYRPLAPVKNAPN